jgi:hypothetical protein
VRCPCNEVGRVVGCLVNERDCLALGAIPRALVGAARDGAGETEEARRAGEFAGLAKIGLSDRRQVCCSDDPLSESCSKAQRNVVIEPLISGHAGRLDGRLVECRGARIAQSMICGPGSGGGRCRSVASMPDQVPRLAAGARPPR